LQIKVDCNSKGTICREQAFEQEEGSHILALFRETTQVVDGLFLGGQSVFVWKEDGTIDMYDNIFGNEIPRMSHSTKSPLVDEEYRRLVYILDSEH